MEVGDLIPWEVKTYYVPLPPSPMKRDHCLLWVAAFDGEGKYYLGGNGLYFTNEQDAVIVALKWS